MLIGAHSILFTADAEADRNFFRDVLQFPSVDSGGGWLIFKLPPGELACHPTDGAPTYELYLMCDDAHAEVEKLKAAGVEITKEITNEGWGLLTALKTPSGSELGLYQPTHPMAFDLT
ncbi:MAG: extradiol dioxygenase [Actinomycetota bacterium]|nr:extradiol dioxygenase [Actinomycetota bacterium]